MSQLTDSLAARAGPAGLGGRMKLYKLTDQNGQTYGGTQWGENVTHKATGKGTNLCSDGWIHAYEDPFVALFLNPIHGDVVAATLRLWECDSPDGGPIERDGPLKCGVKTLTTERELPVPVITTEQRVAFAIYCGRAVYQAESWNRWAEDWLSGKDRSAATSAARAAAEAAWAAAGAARAFVDLPSLARQALEFAA